MIGGVTVSYEVSLNIISMHIALTIKFMAPVDFFVKSSICKIAFSSLTFEILLWGEGSSFESSSLRVYSLTTSLFSIMIILLLFRVA